MTTGKLTLFAILLLPLSLMAQTWEPVTTGLTGDLSHIYFTSETKGYVLDDAGTLNYTDDGGSTWTEIEHPLPSTNSVNGLYVWNKPEGDIIYMSGNDNSISGTNASLIRSDDSGANWTTQDIGHTNGFENFIVCTDETNCHLVGGQTNQGGMIASTTTGGPIWNKTNMSEVAFFSHADFPTRDVGYAVGLHGSFFSGTVYKTTDGGATWSNVAEPGSNSITCINCMDVDNCVAGDGAGNVWKTTDGGTTWNMANAASATWINSVGFADASNGYMAYAGGILKTTDGGDNWTADNGFSGTESLNEIQVIGHLGVGFAVGDAGTLYKATLTANSVNEVTQTIFVDVWPNPAKDILKVRSESVIQQIIVRNVAGQIVAVQTPQRLEATMDVKSLPAGLYFMDLQTESGNLQRKLILATE